MYEHALNIHPHSNPTCPHGQQMNFNFCTNCKERKQMTNACKIRDAVIDQSRTIDKQNSEKGPFAILK